ncbi:MAG TPA: aldehyde dehydrogenase family protein, partial [Baekduia sp.]|nr:aldehyde dehydrogenase family protein [Baekduia sp.]
MATVSVQHHQMFIDGKDVDSDDLFEIRSPATGEMVCTMAKGRIEHADQAVEAARRAFDRGDWSRKPQDERSAIMKRIAERLGTDLEEFIEAEIGPNGATVRQATGFHVGLAGPHFLHFAEAAATYEFERDVPTQAYPTLSLNRIRREPLGVCAAIVPWNFPLVLGIWKIAPALAAGNSVVVKVDEKTPLSLLRLAQVAHEEGVPAGVLNVVTGEGAEVGARLASHPDVDKVAFTGSTAVGREIMRLASGTVKKVSLELGGKAP